MVNQHDFGATLGLVTLLLVIIFQGYFVSKQIQIVERVIESHLLPLSVDTSLTTNTSTSSNGIFHSSNGSALNRPGQSLDSNEVGHVGQTNPPGLQFH